MPLVPSKYADTRSYRPNYSRSFTFPDGGKALEEAFANA
jgi:hypothetical protein